MEGFLPGADNITEGFQKPISLLVDLIHSTNFQVVPTPGNPELGMHIPSVEMKDPEEHLKLFIHTPLDSPSTHDKGLSGGNIHLPSKHTEGGIQAFEVEEHSVLVTLEGHVNTGTKQSPFPPSGEDKSN